MTSLVSIIIPCYNEEKTIVGLMDAIVRQTYPIKSIEVIIADGNSTDQTREKLEGFRKRNPNLKVLVIENNKKIIPAALNRAIEKARGEIIVRLDAHCKPHPDYVALCVDALVKKRGDNVGGIWIVKPGGKGLIARSIAKAGSNPIGVGDAFYRYAEKPALVDTVPFGAFYKSLFAKVGYYNESLLTNEDYELNTRIRNTGRKIWLDPKIKTEYFARTTYHDLSRQFYRYGYWKWKMLKQYSSSLRYRQVLPPIFIFSIISLLIASIFLPIFRWLLLCEIGLYAVILVCASTPTALQESDPGLILGMPIAFATMHFSWGTGFILSMFGKDYH
jgi:succinoglycan biosynthesis protein ExoA